MFFADPPAAFANLRRALKPGGRIGFVCWRTLFENPWMTVPMGAVLKHLPPPPPPASGAPGPFAFADPERIRSVLGEAGFTGVEARPIDLPLGGFSVDDALRMSLRIGPVGAMLRDNPEVAPKVVDDIREALAAHATDGRVALPGAVWIVTARNG
jgi:SAM-dependent methyltransferase